MLICDYQMAVVSLAGQIPLTAKYTSKFGQATLLPSTPTTFPFAKMQSPVSSLALPHKSFAPSKAGLHSHLQVLTKVLSYSTPMPRPLWPM